MRCIFVGIEYVKKISQQNFVTTSWSLGNIGIKIVANVSLREYHKKLYLRI